MENNFGPSMTITYHCKGCTQLITDYYCNTPEEYDRGIQVVCGVNNKIISNCWYERDRAPEWCPALLTVSN
jgi:hypothetical protein